MIVRLMALVSLFLGVSLPASPAEPVFTVAVSENSSAVLQVRDGKLSGIAAPLYRCVFDRSGAEFSFVQMPLARALHSFEYGKAAVVVPVSQTAERDRYGVFAGPLIEVQYLLLSPHPLSSFDSISSMFYVLPRGHIGKQFVEDFSPGGFHVNSWAQVFEMLRRGRAGFTVVPRVILEDILGKTEMDFHTMPAGTIPSSMYISNVFLNTDLEEGLIESVADCRRLYAEAIDKKQRHFQGLTPPDGITREGQLDQ